MTGSKRPVALVTGGAQRIGLAIVEALSTEFDLAIHANHSIGKAGQLARRLGAAGGHARAFEADFLDPESAGRMVETVAQHFGRIDLVVNSASVFEYDTAETFTVAQMNHSLAVNLVAQLVIARTFATVASPEGLLVNMLDNKVFAPNPDYFSYSIAKFGLKGATEMLAMQYRQRIRVNAIAPGNTLVSGRQSEAGFAKNRTKTLTGAGPTPQDIASTVQFIWNTKSLNGETVILDGGQRLMSLERDVAFLGRSDDLTVDCAADETGQLEE